MKPSKNPSSFFLPPSPCIREYSISFATNQNSSTDLEYIPINPESSNPKNPSKNITISKPSVNSNSPTIKPSLSQNSKYKELIRNSPFDRFINADDYLGKFPNVLESSDPKPLTKDPSAKLINNSTLNTIKPSSSHFDLNHRPLSANKATKEQETIGRNMNFIISPSQRNEKNDRIIPSPRKNELITPSKNSNNTNNFLLNPTPKGKKSENSTSPRGENKKELKATPSPKMGWDNNNYNKKSNLTAEIDYIQAKIQDFNNLVIKTPEKNKFPVKEPFSAQKDDRIRGANMVAVHKKSYNEIRTVTPKKDRDLMNLAVFTNDNQKKTFNEFNASPKKDKNLMNFAPFTNPKEIPTQTLHNHKKSYNDTFQSSEINNKIYTPEPKSAREQYKLISPENKDKISLDFLMKSNVSTKSNANNIINLNNNNNNNNNGVIGNNNYTVTATTIPNNNTTNASSNNKKLPMQSPNMHGLSVSPNKLKHTQSSLLNELESASNANKSIIKKSFDVPYFDGEKKGFGAPLKTFSQFDTFLPQNSLAMTSKSNKDSGTLKKNDKTDELKQMAFDIFKPKKQENIEKSEKLKKLPETNTPAKEVHEKPENTTETPIEYPKSNNSFSIEERKDIDGRDEISFRKISFGNKLLENVMEENSEKTPLFSYWDSSKLNEEKLAGKSEKKKDEESQKTNEKLINKQKDEEEISRFSLDTNYPTGKPREKSLEKPDLTLAAFEHTLEKPLNDDKDQENSNPLEDTVKIQEISAKKNMKNKEKREESLKKQEEEGIEKKGKVSIKSDKEIEKNKKQPTKSDDKMSPESLKMKSNFKEIEENQPRNVVIPEKQSFSITITEPSIINDDKTTSKESSNSITSIIMKRSKQLNNKKSSEIEEPTKIDGKKPNEKIEKIEKTPENEKVEKKAQFSEKAENNKEEEKSPLQSNQTTDFSIEEIPKKRSISCKNTKESPMKKSLKLRKESDDNDNKLLKAKAPNSGDKKVSFTDVKMVSAEQLDKKNSYKINVSEVHDEENKEKISKKLSKSENLSNPIKNNEKERKKSSKDEENEKKLIENDKNPKRKKSSKESITTSENSLKKSIKDLKKTEISPEIENSQKKTIKKSLKKSSIVEKPDENSPNLKNTHHETNTLKKKPSKPLDDQNLDDVDKGNEELPGLIKKGSKTTKNQEVVQKETDKLMFPKSPKSRPKSVQRERKNTEGEVKMDFLNLNEFISTLSRGEVLPKRNSAKTPNDLHINLELLQKIAQEQENANSLKDSQKSSAKSSPSKKMSKKSSMNSSIKKSVLMPEIPEKSSKKNSKKSIESFAGEKQVVSEESSENDSDSSSSSSSEKNDPLKGTMTLSVNMNESEKLSRCSSVASDEDMMEDDSQEPDFVYYMSYMRKFNKTNCKSNYFKELYCEHLMQSFKALNCFKDMPEVDEEHLARRIIFLDKKETHIDKKTLIFDLDETLIHCNESLAMPCDVILSIKLGTGTVIEAGINVRPYAVEILKDLSEDFEIIVFTASHSCYANKVLDHLDPNHEFIHHRLSRENCILTADGAYVKDLRIFANRNLKDIAIVDNASYSFAYQIENGVPIIPFYHNKNDEELKHLKKYLMQFKYKDITETNRETFKLHLYAESDEYLEIVNKMFPD